MSGGAFVEGFRVPYSPGAVHPGSRREWRRSKIARKAGRASGRARRRLAHARRGNVGRGQQHLQLSYELRQPSRRQFDREYAKCFPPPTTPQGLAQWERGRETVWVHAMNLWRLVCARGQHCDATKPRSRTALQRRGRDRHERHVRRLNIRLEQLGYAALIHRRTPQDQKDYLTLEWRLHRRLRSFDVTHPPGTTNPPLRGRVGCCSRGRDRPISQPEERPPPDSQTTVTEEEEPVRADEVESEIRFTQMKLDAGFGDPEQHRLRLRVLGEVAKIEDPERRQARLLLAMADYESRRRRHGD